MVLPLGAPGQARAVGWCGVPFDENSPPRCPDIAWAPWGDVLWTDSRGVFAIDPAAAATIEPRQLQSPGMRAMVYGFLDFAPHARRVLARQGFHEGSALTVLDFPSGQTHVFSETFETVLPGAMLRFVDDDKLIAISPQDVAGPSGALVVKTHTLVALPGQLDESIETLPISLPAGGRYSLGGMFKAADGRWHFAVRQGADGTNSASMHGLYVLDLNLNSISRSMPLPPSLFNERAWSPDGANVVFEGALPASQSAVMMWTNEGTALSLQPLVGDAPAQIEWVR